MKSVVVTPKDESEMKFISNLLHKLRIASKIVSAEELEDSGLSLLMKKVDRTKKVSRETVMKKLRY